MDSFSRTLVLQVSEIRKHPLEYHASQILMAGEGKRGSSIREFVQIETTGFTKLIRFRGKGETG